MDVRSGYINVGSVTGISLRRLSKTEAFGYYDFYGSPWIPMVDWKDIAQESFPGCQLFSLKEMVEGTDQYSDWRRFETAITNAESKMHFFRDGPIYATAVSSFKAGVERVYHANQDRIREGRERGSLIRWTSIDSGSVRR